MNQISKTLLAGLAGTTVMTADSELMSRMFGENFSEPEHLATMISALRHGIGVRSSVRGALGN